MLRLACLAAVTLLGCGAPPASTPQPVTLSLKNATRAATTRLLARISARPGAPEARLNLLRVQIEVQGAISPDALLKTCAAEGLSCTLGAGGGTWRERDRFPKDLDVVWLSRDGAAVDLDAHAVPGKVTVFDFYAPWCQLCRVVDELMVDHLRDTPNLAYRKINVVDWDTPAAKAHLAEASGLPFLLVYDRQGHRVTAIDGLKPSELSSAIYGDRSLCFANERTRLERWRRENPPPHRALTCPPPPLSCKRSCKAKGPHLIGARYMKPRGAHKS